MLTIYETPTFVSEAAKFWSTNERLEFLTWIAGEPEAGTVIPGSGGCRKVRWTRDNIPGHLLRAIRQEIEDGST